MNHQDVFRKIDELNEQYLKMWEDVCNIESPTVDKAGVDAVGRVFAAAAKERGWQVEIEPMEKAGDLVCITMNPDAKKAPIVLSGHLDTVFPVGSFGTPAVRREGDKIYGPGVVDCKGGAVAGFYAMDALAQCGYTDRPILLLLQTDEEGGSHLSGQATINSICKRSEGAVAFLNLEGHTKGEICIERKGIQSFRFTVEGKEAHASKCFEVGANAILDAAHRIIELEQFKDGDGITCCCSLIQGGSTINTVPGLCTFSANVRYVTLEQREWICNYMEEMAAKTYVEGCRCTVTYGKGRPPMEFREQNLALLERIADAVERCGLPRLHRGKRRTGGSDAAYLTLHGVPCVDNLGTCGGEIHTTAEWAWVDSLKQSAQWLAAFICEET